MGQSSRMRTMVCRAWRTTRAGVCQSCQRSVLGSALASGPRRHSSWNQRTRSAAKHTSAIHARLASRSVNGNRSRPEALSRRMWSSTWAWARRCTSASTGLPARSVNWPQNRIVQRREQAGLRARVQRLAAHDEPGAFGPAGQVDEVGELRHRGAVALVAGLGERRGPPVLVVGGPADRRFDLRVRAGHDRRSRCCGPGTRPRGGRCNQPSRLAPAPRDAPSPGRHRRGGRPRSAPGAGRWRRRARPADRRSSWPSRCPAATSRRAPRRWHPRSRTWARTRTRACSWRRCLPCSRNECRPATRRDPRSPAPCPWWPTIVATPGLGSRPSPPTDQPRCRVDRPERAIQRRVRRHRAEQRRLGAEPFDVRARLAATGEHQHRLHQHLAAIVEPEPRPRDRADNESPNPQPIRERTQRVQPDMSDDLLAAAFHHHRNRAVSVHLAKCPPDSGLGRVDNAESPVWRALPRMGHSHHKAT